MKNGSIFLETSPSRAADDKKSETYSEGKDMKRYVFGVTQKRRTTRAERMANYMNDAKRMFHFYQLLLR